MELIAELLDCEVRVGVEAFVGEVADRDGTVVTLKHEWTERGFGTVFEECAAGGAGDLDVFVNEKTVEGNFGEAGVFRFLAGGVEARGLKYDVQRLPETRGAAGVGAGRGALVAFLAGAAGGVPALINAAAVGGGRSFFPPAVEELDLVAALQIHAGVRAGGHEEFESELDVAVFPRGEEMAARFLGLTGIAHEDAGAGGGGERFVATRVAGETGGELPVGGDGFEGRERIEGDAFRREERLGAGGGGEGREDREGGCDQSDTRQHAERGRQVRHSGKWSGQSRRGAGEGAN